MSPYEYIIADSQSNPLAHALLETPADAPELKIRVLDGEIQNVLEHEIVQLVGISADTPALAGRILRQEGDSLVLEPGANLGESVRQNLRVPVRFDSFIYPVSGVWEGRFPIVCHDLSCGGIAFFCNHTLQPGEVVELVIPITEQPLLVRTKILRTRPSNSNIPLYAAEFVNLVRGMESMLREAVFGRQILNRDNR